MKDRGIGFPPVIHTLNLTGEEPIPRIKILPPDVLSVDREKLKSPVAPPSQVAKRTFRSPKLPNIEVVPLPELGDPKRF
jgi:hypothetical protein